MGDQQDWVSLAGSLDGEDPERWLGVVVVNERSPSKDFAPNPRLNKNDLDPRQIWPALSQKPASIGDVKTFLESHKSIEAKSKLSNFLKADASKGKEGGKFFESSLVKKHSLEAPRLTFKELLKSDQYRKSVKKIVQRNKDSKFMLVTGVLVASQNTSFTTKQGVKHNAELHAGVDGEMLGAGPGLDVSAGAERANEKIAGGESHFLEPIIFGMSYDYVVVRKHAAKLSWIEAKDEFELGAEVPGDINQFLGGPLEKQIWSNGSHSPATLENPANKVPSMSTPPNLAQVHRSGIVS